MWGDRNDDDSDADGEIIQACGGSIKTRGIDGGRINESGSAIDI